MKLNEAVAARILEYCNNRNITVNKLCTMSGVIQSTVNSIFSGNWAACPVSVSKPPIPVSLERVNEKRYSYE